MNTSSHSLWARANAAFRDRDFEGAVTLYQQAIIQADEPMRAHIRFNLDLALQRMGKYSASVEMSDNHTICGHTSNISIELFSDNDEKFLDSLFWAALGRKPQRHEKEYYLGELKNNNNNRRSIKEIVCKGEECRRRLRCLPPDYFKRNRVYSCLPLGEVQPDDIYLQCHEIPKVSVLIPAYGKVEHTLACLKSISDYPPKASFEVIVLDDCSPDDSVQILRQVENLQVIVHSENLGFLRSSNSGARHAKGEYLFFLNNDTQVTPGWMDELLDTFANFPTCGLAGSKLIYPDGLLQEAGGIVWKDGSAWNYGNRQDPSLPQFNYAREADYISGASIMVPARLFRELGGFNEIYAPAYYEDTDLAMRIRELGLKVIYQPLSEVIHFEGVTSGTDTAEGAKSYQVVNGKKFLERWEASLANHRPNGVEPHLERDRNVVGRVLFIDACTPTPDQDSGSIDTFNLMKVFIEMGWAVTFIPEDNYAFMEKYTPALQRIGVQMLYRPHVNSVDEHITECGRAYNLIMSFRPRVTANHIDNIRQKCPNSKFVFNTVDLHFLRLEREGVLKNNNELIKQAEEMKELELGLMKKADLSTVVSSVEHKILHELGIERVVHLPFSREIRPSNVPFEHRSGMIFVGGFQHTPNVDAVQYFVAEIMPKLRKEIPGIVLNVVGSNTPQTIKNLSCEDVVVHGYIENIHPLLNSVRLNVAPLRYGAGTKGKVVEAMISGLPTVGSSIAFEGMGIKDILKTCVADSPMVFVDKIKLLYNNAEIWNVIARSGFIHAENVFSLRSLKEKLERDVINLR